MDRSLTNTALTALAFFAVPTLTLLAANATPLVLNCKTHSSQTFSCFKASSAIQLERLQVGQVSSAPMRNSPFSTR
jgi:hypothetical protein